MHDLWIVQRESPRAAVEITAAADPESIKLTKVVNSGGRLIVEGLEGGWLVSLEPFSARAKWRAKQIPRYLAELEAAGVREVNVEAGAVITGRWAPRARDLGITHVFQSDTDFPGSVYFSPDLLLERSGGFVPLNGDPIAAWVGNFLRDERPDVVNKLGRSNAAERHAFVLVPGFTTAPFAVSVLLTTQHIALPVIDPQLPTEVTHVWVVGMWHDVDGCYWDPAIGWSRVRTPPAPGGGESLPG